MSWTLPRWFRRKMLMNDFDQRVIGPCPRHEEVDAQICSVGAEESLLRLAHKPVGLEAGVAKLSDIVLKALLERAGLGTQANCHAAGFAVRIGDGAVHDDLVGRACLDRGRESRGPALALTSDRRRRCPPVGLDANQN